MSCCIWEPVTQHLRTRSSLRFLAIKTFYCILSLCPCHLVEALHKLRNNPLVIFSALGSVIPGIITTAMSKCSCQKQYRGSWGTGTHIQSGWTQALTHGCSSHLPWGTPKPASWSSSKLPGYEPVTGASLSMSVPWSVCVTAGEVRCTQWRNSKCFPYPGMAVPLAVRTQQTTNDLHWYITEESQREGNAAWYPPQPTSPDRLNPKLQLRLWVLNRAGTATSWRQL